MARDLAEAESVLKKSLDPMVAKIIKDKNLCLWKALPRASDYDDIDIVDSVASGINLVGSHGEVKALDEDLRLSARPLSVSAAEKKTVETSNKGAHWL